MARFRFIKRAQELDFTLNEVKELLTMDAAPGAAKADVKEHAEATIADIEAKLYDLSQTK